jgi:hypothetical protein
MSATQRAHWGLYWLSTVQNRSGRFVNEFSTEGREEDFAECFRFYLADPADLKQRVDGERYNFIEAIYNSLK